MEHAIRKYLCKREDAMLDPGIGTSWMLVPRIGYAEHQMFGAHSLHTGEKNLDEYLLVKRKSWMVPKPGTQISAKTGRGGAKLIHLDKGVTGTTLGVMLAKAYFFLEKTSYKVEFHVHFSNDFKYTEKEMLKELMTQKCGLALHPQVIQWQLPMGCNISVRPVSNGRELVWVVGKGRDQSNLVARAKLAMENSMATPVFAISRGREMRKDRILRLAQDEREIARLRKEGRSFAHILERQRDAAIREENLKSMFKNVNLTRRAKKKERDQTRLQNRLAHQKRRLLMLPNRLFQQKEFFRQKDFFYRHLDPREPDSEPGSLYSSRMYREGCQIEREAKRKAFVASRNARKAKKRASFGTGASYLKSAQIRAPKVELRGKSGSGRSFRRVQKSRFKETVRDVAKRELRLRSPRPAVPSVLGIRMNMASTLKGRKCRKEQRKPDLNLPKGRPTSIRSKIEDMV
ncbi:hypothetical protein DSL72_005204 [Monilinia vaccinii-corymbosi]|uniref:Uncharacterized protein n=1 Tax=Monilinia vaccinii-corymbosi TaxID=61207 RepID=A0A8A3PF21_9HELO|nr:hypothetical protein DSL72_005204 [Monilinia vaccinii-corymbosi]